MGSGLAVSAGIHAGAQASKRRRGAEGVLLVRILLPAASASVVLVERLSGIMFFSGAPWGVILAASWCEPPMTSTRHRPSLILRQIRPEFRQHLTGSCVHNAMYTACVSTSLVDLAMCATV